MNDKQLADRVVALGVGYDGYKFYMGESLISSKYFVHDWRVAGALSEKVDGVEYAKLTDGRWQCLICPPDGTFMRDSWSENESLPRAIIEACVDALENHDE